MIFSKEVIVIKNSPRSNQGRGSSEQPPRLWQPRISKSWPHPLFYHTG